MSNTGRGPTRPLSRFEQGAASSIVAVAEHEALRSHFRRACKCRAALPRTRHDTTDSRPRRPQTPRAGASLEACASPPRPPTSTEAKSITPLPRTPTPRRRVQDAPHLRGKWAQETHRVHVACRRCVYYELAPRTRRCDMPLGERCRCRRQGMESPNASRKPGWRTDVRARFQSDAEEVATTPATHSASRIRGRRWGRSCEHFPRRSRLIARMEPQTRASTRASRL